MKNYLAISKAYSNCVKSFKDLSYDKKNGQYLSNSTTLAFDFDSIKDKFHNQYNFHFKPKSNDALYYSSSEDKWIFVEFKNGVISPDTWLKLLVKNYDSVIIFSEIAKAKFSEIRKKVKYQLVYNAKKNPNLRNHHHLNFLAKKYFNKLDNFCYFNIDIQSSTDFDTSFTTPNTN